MSRFARGSFIEQTYKDVRNAPGVPGMLDLESTKVAEYVEETMPSIGLPSNLSEAEKYIAAFRMTESVAANMNRNFELYPEMTIHAYDVQATRVIRNTDFSKVVNSFNNKE